MRRDHSYWDEDGFSYGGKRRSKEDWAGVSYRDAFKANLDYSVRLSAQRIYYRLCKATQLAVARQVDASLNQGFVPKVKPQIGPAYTNYPSALAVTASLGLTGFLEYQQWAKERILTTFLAEYLQNPSQGDQVRVDPEAYKKVAQIATENVQARLLLEDLSQIPAAGAVEVYRFFLASQETLEYESVPEIIRAVVFFGDLLPEWSGMRLHPMTRQILTSVQRASAPFLERLPKSKPQHLVDLGSEWVRAICRSLAPYLPPSEPKSESAQSPMGQQWAFTRGQSAAGNPPDRIAPLEAKRPPTLFENENMLDRFAQSVALSKESMESAKGKEKENAEKGPMDRAIEIIKEFAQTVDEAGGQSKHAEDMRSDLVERASLIASFKESPIQGNPADGHSVVVPLGDGLKGLGEIYDRALELSDDFAALDSLLESARPLTEQLRRILYPNVVHTPEMERLRNSGALDPGRLPLADVCTAVFRRYRVEMQPDRRGKPVLLIVCDGSGSLTQNPTLMLKNITCAWLNATVGKSISVLAGVHNTDIVRQGVYGPLVRWLYHPRKTPAIGRRDAVRALVALPNYGTGGQTDALSLAFMLNEAAEIARGRMIYLVLITDCGWCHSFVQPKSAKEEVYDFFRASYKQFGNRLHTTLVALGMEKETGFEDLLDKVIAVEPKDLTNPSAVAEKISLYVASCMREQRKLLRKR
jgi:hypothetical protein